VNANSSHAGDNTYARSSGRTSLNANMRCVSSSGTYFSVFSMRPKNVTVVGTFPCSAFAPIVVLLSCSRRRWSVARSVEGAHAKVQVGVLCIAAVGDRQSNTLLFSENATLFSTYNSADGRQTAERSVCDCSQFLATRDDANLNTSQRILSCSLAAARVLIRR